MIKEVNEKQLMSIAAELSFKILLSVFPFVIFLFSVIGFLELNSQEILEHALLFLPDQVVDLLSGFVREVVDVRSIGLLSTSLLMALYSASSGIRAALYGINKAHGRKDTRNFFQIQLISLGLVFLLTLSILLSLLALIFSDIIYNYLLGFMNFSTDLSFIAEILKYIIFIVVLTLIILLIYRIAAQKTIAKRKLLPGAFCTAIVWVLTSKLFNIYINNFARFSKVYGSIAGVFILVFWLNIISTIILAGSEINAILYPDAIKTKS